MTVSSRRTIGVHGIAHDQRGFPGGGAWLVLEINRDIDDRDLAESIRRVAAYRHAPLRPLREVLAGYRTVAQPRWEAWRCKLRLTATIPERFSDLLDEAIEFADPFIEQAGQAQ